MTLWYLTRAHSLFVSLCLHVCFFIRLSPPSYSCFPLLHSLFSPLLFSRHYLRSPFPGTCLSSLFSLPLSSSSNISAHQAYSFFHYYFISSFWHSGNNRQTSLLVSFPLFSLFFFPAFSRSSGFERAATSSQAHLLARANKTKATFPELNLLLRLSSVNWEFSSLKSGGVAGWLLAANRLTPLCVCEPEELVPPWSKGKKNACVFQALYFFSSHLGAGGNWKNIQKCDI